MRAYLIVLPMLVLLATSSCGLGFFFSPHPFGNFLTDGPSPPKAPAPISSVSPATVASGATTKFRAFYNDGFGGTTAYTDGNVVSWKFGGGVTPSKTTEAQPMVTGVTAGTYHGKVLVISDGGKTSYDFTYTVTAP